MYIEGTIIYKDGSRVDINFTPSTDLYLKINDYASHFYGCEAFATHELTNHEINQINATDDYLKDYLKAGCIIDCIIHRGLIIRWYYGNND